jgi:hypothetical protein
MNCQPYKCRKEKSTLAIYGSQFEHHLLTGGSIKCDICRKDLAKTGNDGSCFICSVCDKGMCKSCKEGHKTAKCNLESLTFKPSSLSVYKSEYQHHLSTGGTIKCDICRKALCSLEYDSPCYICQFCNKGMCFNCSKSHEE